MWASRVAGVARSWATKDARPRSSSGSVRWASEPRADRRIEMPPIKAVQERSAGGALWGHAGAGRAARAVADAAPGAGTAGASDPIEGPAGAVAGSSRWRTWSTGLWGGATYGK